MCRVEWRAGGWLMFAGGEAKPNTDRARTCSQIDGPTCSAVAAQGGKARSSSLQLVHLFH